jgi:hypothetical protein
MHKFLSRRHPLAGAFLSTLLIALQVAAAPIKIQPLGDSITYGPGLVPVVAYRYPLFKLLVNAGIDFQYVGTLVDGATYAAVNGRTMSPNHEGHWGYRIDQINAELPGYLNSYSPDWSIVFLGNNNGRDGNAASVVYSQMSTTIDLLRAKNPKVVIFLTCLYQTGGLAAAYDSQYVSLARTKTTANSPIIIVGPPAGWNNTADTYDGTHPNAGGADKLANAFFQAIQTYRGGTATSPRENTVNNSSRAIRAVRTGGFFSINVPVQAARLDVVDMCGHLVLSSNVTKGEATIPAREVGAQMLILRVTGPGYSTTIHLH